MTFLKTRLSVMMFVEYVIWGAWYVTLNTYLTSTLKFSGTEAGAVFGTTAIASLVAPFLVGLLADRWFATERLMATLYVLCAAFLLLATQVTTFVPMFIVLLAVCLCYFPTIALTNAITMQQVVARVAIEEAGGQPFLLSLTSDEEQEPERSNAEASG